jgi:hypothetical protein
MLHPNLPVPVPAQDLQGHRHHSRSQKMVEQEGMQKLFYNVFS